MWVPRRDHLATCAHVFVVVFHLVLIRTYTIQYYIMHTVSSAMCFLNTNAQELRDIFDLLTSFCVLSSGPCYKSSLCLWVLPWQFILMF